MTTELVQALKEKAVQIRKDMYVTTQKIGYAHLGGGMSMADVAVALYYDYLNFDPQNPKDPDRDRFVLSKGHCAHVLYNIFVDKGMYTKEELWSEYNQINGRFGMHPNYHYLKGFRDGGRVAWRIVAVERKTNRRLRGLRRKTKRKRRRRRLRFAGGTRRSGRRANAL